MALTEAETNALAGKIARLALLWAGGDPARVAQAITLLESSPALDGPRCTAGYPAHQANCRCAQTGVIHAKGRAYPADYIALPDGGALVTGEDCACGQHVTLFRGTWWDADDTPHECPVPGTRGKERTAAHVD